MSIDVKRTDNGELTTLRVAGKLELETAPELDVVIDKIVEDHRTQVTLDLSGLELIDSSGVAALVGLTKRVRANGGDVTVIGARAQPKEIFKLLRLDKLWPSFLQH